MTAAPLRLASALFVLGVVVVAATITWALLRPDGNGNRAMEPAGRSAVPAGASLPMLQDIDPEDLDARNRPGVSPRASSTPVRRTGDAVVYSDGWKVTLLAVSEQPMPSPGLFTEANAGTRLVVMTLRFENAGKVGARADSFDFKIQHGDAVRNHPSLCYVNCAPDQLFSLDLGPGGSQVRWLRFSAEKADTHLALVYQRIGYREVVWNLY